ncbi:MAG: SDR family oxidoreductase [Candidatus Nanopelagicales bacterium]
MREQDLAGAGVVVTGAGDGIGAALARACAARGARVVVSDRDATAAHRVAQEVSGTTVLADMSDPDAPARLVQRATEILGRIDLFCGNAGIGTAGGVDADDLKWEDAWDVNVMAHVRTVRSLLPQWRRDGSGHLLLTVSAAGLLTMVGSAPYSVTKHAALALAEWLAITHGPEGVTVQALCPQGVRTRMLEASGPVGRALLEPTALDPDEVAERTLADLGGPFLVLPHPEVARFYAARADDTDRWIGSMTQLSTALLPPAGAPDPASP